MDKYTTETTQIQKLERELERVEKNARKFQCRADSYRHQLRKAEKQLATIGQEARNRGLMEGLGYGLVLGAAAVYAEALIWKRIFKK